MDLIQYSMSKSQCRKILDEAVGASITASGRNMARNCFEWTHNCNFSLPRAHFLAFTMWWSYVSKDTPRINYIAILCIHLSSIVMVFSHTKSALATITVLNETKLTTGITD